MKIAIASLARDNIKWHGYFINQVDKYFSQILQQDVVADMHLFLLENNSLDNTYQALKKYESDNIHVFKINIDSAPPVKSIIDNTRFVYLSNVANILLDLINDYGAFDFLFWVEFDIIIKQNSLIRILAHDFSLVENPTIISPLVLHDSKLYDILCFHALDLPQNRLITTQQRFVKMQSIGSCALIRGDLLGQINFGQNIFLEFCRQACQYGNIYTDTTLKVFHPSYRCVEGRWI